MIPLKIRCSSIGKIMTEPKTLKEGPLSVGAKTHIRELAAQDIFGIDFEVSSKEMEKGLEVEQAGIDLLNDVRQSALTKNTERRSNEFITGECDLFNGAIRRGHDLKCSWSVKSFPIALVDCEDRLYEWQMHGYMWLWDAADWEVNYVLVDTPARLIGFEPLPMHIVSHIPANLRLTTWSIQREEVKEALIAEKVKAARLYYTGVVAEFDRMHGNDCQTAMAERKMALI